MATVYIETSIVIAMQRPIPIRCDLNVACGCDPVNARDAAGESTPSQGFDIVTATQLVLNEASAESERQLGTAADRLRAQLRRPSLEKFPIT